jgi:hypothetical protein
VFEAPVVHCKLQQAVLLLDEQDGHAHRGLGWPNEV